MVEKPTPVSARSPVYHAGETNADFRARIEHQQAAAAEFRQSELAEQRSPLNSAEKRIRIWEQLHQLRIPRDPDHPLVEVIAAATHLSVADVHSEQSRRLAPPVPAAAPATI